MTLMHQAVKYGTDRDVATRYNVNRVTVWKWAKEGVIPAPHRIGPNTTRWLLAELDQHDAQLTAKAV